MVKTVEQHAPQNSHEFDLNSIMQLTIAIAGHAHIAPAKITFPATRLLISINADPHRLVLFCVWYLVGWRTVAWPAAIRGKTPAGFLCSNLPHKVFFLVAAALLADGHTVLVTGGTRTMGGGYIGTRDVWL
jgi:hypothetical protein